MVLRAIRNGFIGVVWAGALTALALGSRGFGAALVVLGVVLLVLAGQGRTGFMFGASSKPTTTDPD